MDFIKLTTCSLLLTLFVQQACSVSSQEKMHGFLTRLENRKLADVPIANSDVAVKQSGKVFYPIGYGADPTGVKDSGEALTNLLNDAFQAQQGHELMAGVKDLGGVIVDLQGGNYRTCKPLRLPASGGGNLVIKGGTLRASDKFPMDRYLIELLSPDKNGVVYEGITFRDVLFDSGYHGGGLMIVNSARIRITDCLFIHFTSQGILVKGGHEVYISDSFLGQKPNVGGDPDERHFTGTAIELHSNDNAITDVAIFSAAIGVLLYGQANILTNVHTYNKATYWGGVGIFVKKGASVTRISNCYLDYNNLYLEDPNQVHCTNGFFLGGGRVLLKAIEGKITGLNVLSNMFSGWGTNDWPEIIQVDGTFNHIDQVVIDHNNVNGMTYKSTVGKLTVSSYGTKWIADFSRFLVFPNRINHLQYSIYVKEKPEGFFQHAVTNVTNNVVVVETDKPISASVSVFVDQFSMLGESNFLSSCKED
ncbi:hypothetical protein K2173_000362 [Erythroxylum novogranatense]|uniref:Uncharacterized protein n=1 Tax=Erythroxylum novogranatense TaxID=1862640 RepID=A0AAV8SWY0_9ROSI|nr:hypothetical protein K2173_000362 [Erythroxylum novogranatense]